MSTEKCAMCWRQTLIISLRTKEDKNGIPQSIGKSNITTAFSFLSRTRVSRHAQCAVKTIKIYDIRGKRKQVRHSTLKCVEIEYLQVRLSVIVYPEQAYHIFTSLLTSVHTASYVHPF